jgi:hypothetical protein
MKRGDDETAAKADENGIKKKKHMNCNIWL